MLIDARVWERIVVTMKTEDNSDFEPESVRNKARQFKAVWNIGRAKFSQPAQVMNW